jgi:hypothetical protein
MRITKQDYEKRGTKWYLTETTDLGNKPEYAENICNSHSFWRNFSSYYRVEKAYFSCGCRDWRMTSISPDKANKVVWTIDWDAE